VKKIRVNVMLGKDQLAALKKKVKANDTTVSQVLRRLIDGYLKKK
jgi:ribbon-helix-helix CopG family protein